MLAGPAGQLLSGMLDFFQTIIDYIGIAFNAVISLVKGLFQFLAFIPSILTFTGSVTSFLPSLAAGFVLANISFAIVLKIIGRKS